LLRVHEPEGQPPGHRRIAPALREFIRIKHRQVCIDNFCEPFEITDFLHNFNNLALARQLGKRAAIAQWIAHGARMIRTRRATVKAQAEKTSVYTAKLGKLPGVEPKRLIYLCKIRLHPK
jgi:hypothetical protein